jgi:hypothetical protein
MRLRFNKYILVSVLILSSLVSFSQWESDIQVLPFKKSTYEDSLHVASNRVKRLLSAQKAFEKTYLRKQLAFMPVPPHLATIFKGDTLFLEPQQYLPLLQNYPKLAHAYKRFNLQLNAILDSINPIKRQRNVETEKIIRQSPQVQTGVEDIYLRRDYAIVLVPERFFTRVGSDVTENEVIDTLEERIEQILLGKPYDLDGYVNSVNYIPFDLKRLTMPDLVDRLVEADLRLWQRIIDIPAYRNAIRDVRINDVEIYNNGKLWLNTDVFTKTVYLSPYLLRAVFNVSFYQDTILRRAVAIESDSEDITVYFREKSGASIYQIDSAYFENFVRRFGQNLFFVLGHELAHIYLEGKIALRSDIETACDTYAAYFYLKHFGQLQTGVFSTMLISAIKSKQLEFWGSGIDKKALQRRYNNLQAIQKAGNANAGAIRVSVP